MKSELFRFLPRPKEWLKNQNEKDERVYVINIARLRPEIKYLSYVKLTLLAGIHAERCASLRKTSRNILKELNKR